MNYACISDQPFVTTKDLSKRKPLSEEARARREFIRGYQFEIDTNPSTQEAELKVFKE